MELPHHFNLQLPLCSLVLKCKVILYIVPVLNGQLEKETVESGSTDRIQITSGNSNVKTEVLSNEIAQTVSTLFSNPNLIKTAISRISSVTSSSEPVVANLSLETKGNGSLSSSSLDVKYTVIRKQIMSHLKLHKTTEFPSEQLENYDMDTSVT